MSITLIAVEYHAFSPDKTGGCKSMARKASDGGNPSKWAFFFFLFVLGLLGVQTSIPFFDCAKPCDFCLCDNTFFFTECNALFFFSFALCFFFGYFYVGYL